MSKLQVRLSEVARVAGVSLATASRALSSSDAVSPLTRQNVRNTAVMLGYLPHGAARALASRRSRAIGAVFPVVDNPIFATATQALARELASLGYTLLLATHQYDLEAEVEMVRVLLQQGVDGLVLVGLDHTPALFTLLAQAGVPYELTWSLDPAAQHHCVGFAHRLASIRVTQHLLDLGHRELAVIAGITAGNDRIRERLAGVREALAAWGIDLRPDRIVEAAFAVSEGRSALGQLLARAGGFTAVICGNDLLGIGALLECGARGIGVAARMSVVGFDDNELSAEIPPGLTTVRVPSTEIGRRVAQRLVARLNGGVITRVEELKTELIVRGSSGPPERSPVGRRRTT